MSNHPKKHHYVPQSVLKHFSADNTKTNIYVFDKISQRSYLSSIRNAGCENYFNTVDDINGKSVCYEGLFQTNDDHLARLFHMIASNRSIDAITTEDRYTLSEVVATQIVRTNMLRTSIRSISEQLLTLLHEFGLNPGDVDGCSIPTDKEVRRVAFTSLFNLREIISALQDKKLILIHTTGPKVFWTSDNPVVLHNTFPYGEMGLNSLGIEIYLPISSELVLGFYCPSIELKIRQGMAVKHPIINCEKFIEIYRGLHEGIPVSLGPETHPFLNSLQILNSSRFLYAQNDNFEHAKEIIEKNPDASDIRSLLSVGPMGQGTPARSNMPPGLWVVFYGNQDHCMIPVDTWNQSSEFLEFETRDLVSLHTLVNDQRIMQAVLFQDGIERRGMRDVKVEIQKRKAHWHVLVTHHDEALNKLFSSMNLPK